MTKLKKTSIKIERLLTLYQMQRDAYDKYPEIMSLAEMGRTIHEIEDVIRGK